MIKQNLTSKQIAFLKSQRRGAVFQGGRGAGKSWILCMWAVLRALKGRKVCIVADAYPRLRDFVLPTFLEIFKGFGWIRGVEFDWSGSDNTIKFNSSEGTILLRSGDDPNNLRGLNLHDFGVDEARNFKTNEVFLIMLGTIRLDDKGEWRICSTTRGKNWVWRLQQDAQVDSFIQSSYDNPFLAKQFLDDMSHHYTGAFARQELYADIVSFSAGVINPSWFNAVEPRQVDGAVRFWDLAVSTKTSADFSSGALCGLKDGRFTIHNIAAHKLAWPDLKKKIIEVARIDGSHISIGVEEAGQLLGLINDLQTTPELQGFTIRGIKPQGDKFNRCMPWIARAESGMVDMVKGHWNDSFLDECSSFSADLSHEHDDQIDSVSGAYAMLSTSAPQFRTF